MRTNLPICSDFAAEVKRCFSGVRMTYASEAGSTIGRPDVAPAFSVSGDALMDSITKPIVKGQRNA